MGVCGCGTPFEGHAGKGQRKRYCSDRCRQRAHRDRHTHERMSRLEGMLDQVMTGDCRALVTGLPEHSIDLIFTDPPYPKAFLPLYGWLAEAAARVLKPGGFVLTYAGNMYLHEVMMQLGHHLTYFWSYIALDSGAGQVVWPRKTLARHKAILAYSKGPGTPRCHTLDVWSGSGKDKRYHAWGQDVSTARYYIDCFSRPGQIVLDPFVGGGTTCVAARLIDRRWIGCEIDASQAERARTRVAIMQLPLTGVSMHQRSFEAEGIG